MQPPVTVTTPPPVGPAPTETAAQVSLAPSPNGGTSPGYPNRGPNRSASRSRPWSGRTRILLAVGGLLLVGLAAGAAFIAANSQGVNKDLIKARVKKQVLTYTLVERGTLESEKKVEITCLVQATKGGSYATTIKALHVEDGETIHKGDLLMTLDSAALEDQLKSQRIVRDNAKLELDQAAGDLKITRDQNESDKMAAQTKLDVARLALKQYLKGDFPAKEEDLKGQKEQWLDRVAYSKRMVAKKYLSASQLQGDELSLKKVLKLLDALYLEKEKLETQYTSDVKQAELNQKVVEKQCKTKEEVAVQKRDSKKGVFAQESDRTTKIEEEIAKCTIKAPQDGMVVYVIPDQARWGGGAQTSIIAQGEPVREGQKMMQIPDLSRMQVNVKIHEALVSNVQAGQRARIKLEAFHNRVFYGKVTQVATVESKQDFMAADVKLYQTIITINDKGSPLKGLKPGMSAEVTLEISRTVQESGPDKGKPREVLTIPVQAVIDPQEDGSATCYVMHSDGSTEKRIIKMGMGTDKEVEVKEGLKEGEDVVQNPEKVTEKKRSRSSEKPTKDQDFKDKAAAKPGPGKPPGPGGKPGPAVKDGKPGAGARGGPGGAGARGGPGGAGARGGQIPADMAERIKKFDEDFRKATPEKRKQMLMQIPEDYRDAARQKYQGMGLKIAD
jgi:multidrug efflux pump subunit AcrA (membrane-fusion protein)